MISFIHWNLQHTGKIYIFFKQLNWKKSDIIVKNMKDIPSMARLAYQLTDFVHSDVDKPPEFGPL